jgi:hypothetical protein
VDFPRNHQNIVYALNAANFIKTVLAYRQNIPEEVFTVAKPQ